MANGSEMLGAFSHPTRQAIVDLLRQRPSTVGELAGRLPITRPAVSQHLQALKSIGLVKEERRGTRHYFHLDPKSLAELRAHIESMWRDALAGFSNFANKETAAHATTRGKGKTYSTKRPRRLLY
ncbi:MAG TPA: metalloregulator ArsR/SmtB family transcription factor [Bryobacteraceae bacterium]